MGTRDDCHGDCTSPRARPLVACESCGRHVRRDAASCPFCTRATPSRLRGAIVAAAFFGSAAIAGCAYGPPPDDVDGDAAAEVQSDGSAEVQPEVTDEVQAGDDSAQGDDVLYDTRQGSGY
jgi:hypothetical protein